ncbi:hypothetical protein QQ020_19955 [Fulvivirgaceae bacterium BMA12]|uniref:Platelet-activating factor acetylhydrolase n=1 Tax=Agaribacillus aureus TaxID=3051825 RepID=A0ABT8L9D1_9BACT|nr:hypothetical protein [Fulvivirgaceae bacterium BMA12]
MLKINHPKWKLIPGIIAFMVIIHAFFEGYRWQMVSIYILAGMTFLFSLWSFGAILKKQEKVSPLFSWLKWFGWGIGLLALLVGAALCYVFPVFKISEPTGEYSVGVRTFFFEDSDREELITAGKEDRRSFVVRLWYPAENIESLPTSPYISAKIGRYIAERKAPLPFLLSHLNLIKTHSYVDAPLARHQDRYPVLIFSHGYESHPSMYYSFVEEIASHGYIIFFINHTYESSGATFPDGTTVFTDTATVAQTFDWAKTEPFYNKYVAAKTKEEKLKTALAALKSVGLHDRIKYWVADAKFLIDHIHDANFYPALKDKMDLKNLGMLGHSFGGALATEMLMADERVKVAINLDGGQYGAVLDSTVNKPFMYIQADRGPEAYDPNPVVYEKIVRHDFYDLKLIGATHSNFYEVALWSRLKSLSSAGDIDAGQCIRISNQGILLFLDHYLKGHDQNEFHALLKKLPGMQVKISMSQ